MGIYDAFNRVVLHLRAALESGNVDAAKPADHYDLLEMYYWNNALYDELQRLAYAAGIWAPGMKPLRNPAHRAVEFHAAHLWPGPLAEAFPITTNNPKLLPAIAKIDQWGNWAATKQIAARWFALFGDLVIKIAQSEERDRVYKQVIKPKYVTAIRSDERGFVQYCRIDVPQTRFDREGNLEAFTSTEIWERDRFRSWEHMFGAGAEIETMGKPKKDVPLEAMGIDFIPIATAQFRGMGYERGAGCFIHVLDKIDELNRQATRLHQMLFRHNAVTHVISANANDAAGRPLPAPIIGPGARSTAGDGSIIEIGDERFYRLPGMASMQQLVPQLDYAAALNILQAQMAEVERDLPELVYWRLAEMGELSGRAIRMMLGGAEAAVIEARGTGEAAIIRANQMALSIAAAAGDALGDAAALFDPKAIGTYQAGAFDHEFVKREVIPITRQEQIEMIAAGAQAGLPVAFVAKRFAGLSDADLTELQAAQSRDRAAASSNLASALMQSRRSFDQNRQA